MQQTNLVMNTLADVDGFKSCIQVCVGLGEFGGRGGHKGHEQ